MVWNESLDLLETLTFMYVFAKEIFVGTVISLGVLLMFMLFVCMYLFNGIRLYVCFSFQTS